MTDLSDVEKRFLELMGIDIEKKSYEMTFKGRYVRFKYNDVIIGEERVLGQSPKTRTISVSGCTLNYTFDGYKKWSIKIPMKRFEPFRIESYINESRYLYTFISDTDALDDILDENGDFKEDDILKTIGDLDEGPYHIKASRSLIRRKNLWGEIKNDAFTPQNYENVFKNIIDKLIDKKAKDTLTKLIPLISVNIPMDILDNEMSGLKAEISDDPSEEREYEARLKAFEEMKNMFQEYADSKTSDGGKGAKQKHPGEVRK